MTTSETPMPPAGLLRRLAAMFYDALLILALWMIMTACFLPFTDGEAVRWSAAPVLFVAHKLAMALVVVCFYGFFWTRRGQTLGMAAWRLCVQRVDGRLLTWGDTCRRIAAGVLSWLPFGAGWWWCLVDRERRTWHDVLSRTHVIVTPKRQRGT